VASKEHPAENAPPIYVRIKPGQGAGAGRRASASQQKQLPGRWADPPRLRGSSRSTADNDITAFRKRPSGAKAAAPRLTSPLLDDNPVWAAVDAAPSPGTPDRLHRDLPELRGVHPRPATPANGPPTTRSAGGGPGPHQRVRPAMVGPGFLGAGRPAGGSSHMIRGGRKKRVRSGLPRGWRVEGRARPGRSLPPRTGPSVRGKRRRGQASRQGTRRGRRDPADRPTGRGARRRVHVRGRPPVRGTRQDSAPHHRKHNPWGPGARPGGVLIPRPSKRRTGSRPAREDEARHVSPPGHPRDRGARRAGGIRSWTGGTPLACRARHPPRRGPAAPAPAPKAGLTCLTRPC